MPEATPQQQKAVARLLAPYADPCGPVEWPRYSIVSLQPGGEPDRIGGTGELGVARTMARHRASLHGWPFAVCRTADQSAPIMSIYPQEGDGA